jgi:hypothetical protein
MYLMIILGGITIFIFFILPIIQNVSDYSKDKIETFINNAEIQREKVQFQNQLNSYEQEYQMNKRKFQYFSDATLKKMFEKQIGNESPYFLLALEETLVERKLIEYSPTHEKLQKIENYFEKNE